MIQSSAIGKQSLGARQDTHKSPHRADFPPSIPCLWGGPPLTLKYTFPRIWTQAESRAFAMYWSEQFGYGRLHPTPTAEELARFYDTDSYDRYMNPSGHDAPTAQGKRRLVDRILTRLAWSLDYSDNDPILTIHRLVHGGAVCDIGCGAGEFLSQMVAEGFDYDPVGVDPSASAKLEATVKGIDFFLGTAESIPLQLMGRKFDVVTMFQSLEHCTDPSRALNNLRSLLAPGGLACIEVPNHDCIGFDLYGPSWFHTDAGRHLWFFTKRSLTTALEAAGLKAVHWEFDQFTRQFSPEWLRAMQEVWDRMKPDFPRPADSDRLKQFARSLVAPASRRYDVIRVYARTT